MQKKSIILLLIPHQLLLLLLWLPSQTDAVCSPASSVVDTRIQVMTTDGSGTNCYFPFTSGGVDYTDCAPGLSPWCATTCNYPANSGEWRYCKFTVADLGKTNCSGLATVAPSSEPSLLYGGAGSGSTCFFPFLYNDVCHYDCIITTTDPWCATTDRPDQVDFNYKHCVYTLRGAADASCSSLSTSTPVYMQTQTGSYAHTPLLQSDPNGNCTFPFYYRDRCYDDCTADGAQAWYLPWCSTEKYYLPNKKTRVCPYYRKYRTITSLPLQWGFYRIHMHTDCGSGGAFCNISWVRGGAGVPTGFFGGSRMSLSFSSSDVIEVMPQPNGYFILRVPLVCADNWEAISVDYTHVTYESISSEREFWNIKTTGTANVFTIQSTWSNTKDAYINRGVAGGHNVLDLVNSTAVQWRFERLADSEVASLSLPCENPLTTTTAGPTTTSSSDGGWCAWSDYAVSGSVGTRNRTCACPPPSGGLCPGNSTESGPVVNGSWCSWSSYSVSGLYGTRLRDCNCSAPAFGGSTCSDSGNDTGLVVNGNWCPWSEFTVSGTTGTRTRECNCSAPAYGGSTCAGSATDSGTVVNGAWCAWSAFTVSGSTGTRTRECNCSAPAYGGSTCAGSDTDSGTVVNGAWCAWSAFTVSGTTATRTRACSCSASAYGGSDCPGSGTDSGTVTDGVWCAWSAYTVSAGVGTRTRVCNCPAPAYTGASCSGSGTDSLAQVNGTWCEWSGLESGYGYLRRTRECNCSAPNVIGVSCSGSASEDFPCNISSCMTTTPAAVAGGWCEWQTWTPGNVNSGKMFRWRSCSCPAPSGGGAACGGSEQQQGLCTISGCEVIYAEPNQAGAEGGAFHQSAMFNKLIIWGTVTSVCILASGVVGIILMLKHACSAVGAAA